MPLVRNDNPNIVFKSEESNRDDDCMMTPRLSEKVNELSWRLTRVRRVWHDAPSQVARLTLKH